MNIPRRIRTVVVSVPVDNDWLTNKSASRSRVKPSDLLPWSDPTIAKLVRKLQHEVRTEQSRVVAEAEMPWNEPFEYEFDDHNGFSIDTDALLNR
ncbi:hypothetical protein [Aeoliella mucimassa]|uniref:Uncharacterized protein n=1 Tax=Aeoliella mucimassa TaxID=2527972 RepID=A0A518AW83_9BACT|nr:hypothetical protein [Aeoliella mucimassa]QDU58984.1 hypothetical protein Pan181_52250 [Aeoliella mucimassa]